MLMRVDSLNAASLRRQKKTKKEQDSEAEGS
jgi:hypothetical protein